MKLPKESSNGRHPVGIFYFSRNQAKDSSALFQVISTANLVFTMLIGFWRTMRFGYLPPAQFIEIRRE